MKTLADLQKAKAAVKAKADALFAAIQARGADATPTEDEAKQMAAVSAEFKNLDVLIEAHTAMFAQAKEGLNDATATGTNTDAKKPVVEVVQDKDKSVYKGDLGRQLQDIAKISSSDDNGKEQAYNRLTAVEKNHAVQFAASGLTSQKDPDGGYLIEPTVETDLTQTDYGFDDILKYTRDITLLAGSNRFVARVLDDDNDRSTATRLGGVRAYWPNEAETVASSRSKMRQVEGGLHKQMAIGYATEENLEDAGQLASMFPDMFEQAMDENTREAIFYGSGVEQPQGFMNSPALLTIPKEAGQTDKLMYENIINMETAMPAAQYKRAVWLANQELKRSLPKIKLDLGDTQYPVFAPAGSNGQTFDTLRGRPLLYTEQSAAPGEKGDLVLVDLSQYVRLRKGVTRQEQSMHVRFLWAEMAFRAVRREGGFVLPKGPITPKRGSAGFKMASFIALQAR